MVKQGEQNVRGSCRTADIVLCVASYLARRMVKIIAKYHKSYLGQFRLPSNFTVGLDSWV